MRRVSSSTPFVGLDELAASSSKDAGWNAGAGSGEGAELGSDPGRPTGTLLHARDTSAGGTGGTGDTVTTAFARRASTGAVTPSGEGLSPLRGRRPDHLPRLRSDPTDTGGGGQSGSERKRSRSVTVLPHIAAGEHSVLSARPLAAHPSWIAAGVAGSGDAKASPHTLARRMSSQGMHRGTPIAPSLSSGSPPRKLHETGSWCEPRIGAPKPRPSAASAASGGAGGGKRRRSSTIVVSKESADAAKKMVNKWGGVKSIQAKLSSTHKRPFCILSPGSRFMRKWDTLTLVCLIVVAVLTPFELAFLEVRIGDPLFAINRVIDTVFVLDIIFTFFLEYRDPDTMLWIYSYRMIATRYAQSWLFIDVVSVLPFDLTASMLSSEGVKSLAIVRVLRVAKLAKLARVMRLARIHARWERDLSVPFATLALGKFAVYMLTMTHWFACLWGLLGSVQSAEAEQGTGYTTENTSWLQYFGYYDKPPLERYIASVHWAMQTVSTIGYGDIRAVTTPERFVTCFCMAYGASVWTYVVASVCGIVTSLDPHGTHRKHTIAEVNEFMQSKRLPARWRPRLRSFFISRENYHRTLASRRLLRLMSPTLRGEVTRHLNKNWIHRVNYLRSISDAFLTELAMSMEQEFYAPEEIIRSECLHILEKGVCLQDSRVIPVGFVWGEDMILENPLLRNRRSVYTLAHTHVHKLDRASFFHILSFFPDDRHVIIAAARWMTVKRKLLFWMAGIRENGEDVKEGLLRRVEENAAARLRARQLRAAPLSLLTLAASSAKSHVGSLLQEFGRLRAASMEELPVPGGDSGGSTDDGVVALSSASTAGWGGSTVPMLQGHSNGSSGFGFGAGAGAGTDTGAGADDSGAGAGHAADKYVVRDNGGAGPAGNLQHPLLTPKTDESQGQADIARLLSLDDDGV